MVGSQKGDIYSFSIITHEVRRARVGLGPRSMPRSMYQGQRCFNLFTVGDFIPGVSWNDIWEFGNVNGNG